MLLAFLKKPYPYLGDLKKDIFRNFYIGAFVALFLIVFKPFQIDQWQTSYKILKLAGFGLISFLIPCFFGIIMQLAVSEKLKDNWTVGHEVLLLLANLLFIAAGNLVYGKLLYMMPFNTNALAFAIGSTFLIGVFPVSAHVFRRHHYLLKRNLEQSLLLNQQLNQQAEIKNDRPEQQPLPKSNTLTLTAENEKDAVTIPAAELLFIESADNYATLVSMVDGKKKKELIRSSLKRIESQLSHPDMMRCHRAYIVNLGKIKTVEGNAAGYKLYFADTEDMVPVSRSYVQPLSEKLKQRS